MKQSRLIKRLAQNAYKLSKIIGRGVWEQLDGGYKHVYNISSFSMDSFTQVLQKYYDIKTTGSKILTGIRGDQEPLISQRKRLRKRRSPVKLQGSWNYNKRGRKSIVPKHNSNQGGAFRGATIWKDEAS